MLALAVAMGLPVARSAAEPREPEPTQPEFTQPEFAQTGAQGPLSADLAAAGWRLLEVPGKAPARFSGDEGSSLQVSSNGGVGFLYRPLAASEAGKLRLSWRWRVESAPPPSDLSVKGADDRPGRTLARVKEIRFDGCPGS